MIDNKTVYVTSDIHGYYDKWIEYYNKHKDATHVIVGDICTHRDDAQERKLLL